MLCGFNWKNQGLPKDLEDKNEMFDIQHPPHCKVNAAIKNTLQEKLSHLREIEYSKTYGYFMIRF